MCRKDEKEEEMNTVPIVQRYLIYLLVFAAAGLLIFVVVQLIQAFSLERYDRQLKNENSSGHRNDIGYFIEPKNLFQIQLSLGVLMLGIAIAVLLFVQVFYWYVLMIAAVVTLLLGFVLPLLYFHRKVKKRARDFERSILDFSMGLTSGLRAGQALPQALEVFSRRCDGPMKEELGVVLREYRLGLELTDALQRMYDRLPCEDLQLLIISIRLTLQSGGSLADVLQKITETIRGRIEFYQKLQALTAQGRFEALAMSLAPLLAIILLFIINNDLMLPMVQTLIGWTAIGIMLTLDVIGYIVIRAIVNVKL